MNLQYDRLYVDGRCYGWSQAQGRVLEQVKTGSGKGSGTGGSIIMLEPGKGNNCMIYDYQNYDLDNENIWIIFAKNKQHIA